MPLGSSHARIDSMQGNGDVRMHGHITLKLTHFKSIAVQWNCENAWGCIMRNNASLRGGPV